MIAAYVAGSTPAASSNSVAVAVFTFLVPPGRLGTALERRLRAGQQPSVGWGDEDPVLTMARGLAAAKENDREGEMEAVTKTMGCWRVGTRICSPLRMKSARLMASKSAPGRADLAGREQGFQPLEVLARAALPGSLEGQGVAAPRSGPARATQCRLAVK
jgi:hypothetical protein